eukprot:TRINITY_DN9554_c0_g1_i2.p3 TRINITY_DN9554_c0_g1~~TRINITY_DN9554_c0_g1_i2.p3  ORF type:complete len:108 (-),score=32.73 TRINITY_DN9554_c0_g1_i2:30-353(-)
MKTEMNAKISQAQNNKPLTPRPQPKAPINQVDSFQLKARSQQGFQVLDAHKNKLKVLDNQKATILIKEKELNEKEQQFMEKQQKILQNQQQMAEKEKEYLNHLQVSF